MERLTSEQIRLLEELRELRDSGILTVDEFEFQVAKVLGRPLVVEPSPVDEELLAPAEVDGTVVANISGEAIHEDHTVNDDVVLAPETSPESELLEYEIAEPETSDEDEMLAEENRVVEPLPNFDSPASAVVESVTQQNKSSRRKVLIGTTAGLIVIVGIAVVALGGGKSDSKSSQVIDSTTTVTESDSTGSTGASTSLGNTQAPGTSSQSGPISTTVPQNASSGNATRPTTATTPITTPLSTVANPTTAEPVVTALQLSKSHTSFYDWPWDLQQTATFTALIVNDESAAKLGMRLMLKGPSGWKQMRDFRRVQPGTWEAVWEDVEEFGDGRHEFCVVFTFQGPDTQYASDKCFGPSVSFEVLETDRNPPIVSDVSISPTVVYVGDVVRVRARVVDAVEVTRVGGGFELPASSEFVRCGEFSLISGDARDGVWSMDCEVPRNLVGRQAVIGVCGYSKYSEPGCSDFRLELLPSN